MARLGEVARGLVPRRGGWRPRSRRRVEEVKMQSRRAGTKVKTEIVRASPASTSSGPMKQHVHHPVTKLRDQSRRARLSQLA